MGGYSILIGNAALLANGMIASLEGNSPDVKKAGVGRMTSALGWGLGGLVLSRYGNQPVPRQFEKLQEKLAAHLIKEGVPLDADAIKKADQYAQRSWFQKAEDYLYNYPIECTNVYYSFASLGMMVSGLIRRRGTPADVKAGNANLITGGMILAGTLASLLIPEKSKEQIAAQGQQGTLWGHMQERPLNYAVWAFIASDLSTGAEALGELERAKQLPQGEKFKPWAYAMAGFSAFSMLAAIAGDVLTGFSSKKVSGSDDEIATAKAHIIETLDKYLGQQPEPLRTQFAKAACDYLVHQPELRMTNEMSETLQQALAQHWSDQSTNKGVFAKRYAENKNATGNQAVAF